MSFFSSWSWQFSQLLDGSDRLLEWSCVVHRLFWYRMRFDPNGFRSRIIPPMASPSCRAANGRPGERWRKMGWIRHEVAAVCGRKERYQLQGPNSPIANARSIKVPRYQMTRNEFCFSGVMVRIPHPMQLMNRNGQKCPRMCWSAIAGSTTGCWNGQPNIDG